MAAKYNILSFAVLFLFSSVHAESLQAINGRIKITIGTSAGCGDTVTLFGGGLAEAYELYKDFLDLEFIPWGRTVRNEDNSLTCQFRFNDCWANRYHRCVINLLKDDVDAQMQFMTCEFTNPRPGFNQGSYVCAHVLEMSLVDVDYCVANPDLDDLDAAAEIPGREMIARINNVPAVVFNDDIDPDLHEAALERLPSMICFALADDPNTGVTNCSLM